MSATESTSPINAFKKELSLRTEDYAKMLPEGVSWSRFERTTMTAIAKNPDLLNANRQSLFLAIREACSTGLEIGNTATAEAYFVVRRQKGGGKQVQFQPGYRGLVKLARQSGEISTLDAGVLYENDDIDYRRGTSPNFEVVPNWKDPGEPIGAFAVAVFKDGGFQCKVMSRAEVERIRAKSPAANSGPWVTDYEAMMTKTAIRQLCKMLPLSTSDLRLQRAMDADDVVEGESEAQALPAPVETKAIEAIEAPKRRTRRRAAKTTNPDELLADLAHADESDEPSESEPLADIAHEAEVIEHTDHHDDEGYAQSEQTEEQEQEQDDDEEI